MPDIINNAKEVYYSFRDDHGDRHMVPVRGVYVTGEYKPPSYIEPMLRLVSIKTTHPKIEEYTEVSKSHTSDTNHHLYDVDIDDVFRIDWYSSRTAPSQTADTTQHLYDVDIDDVFRIDWYSSKSTSNTDVTSHHLYDVDIDDYFQFTINPRTIKGSQPEPILRLVEVNINKCIVEDV